MRECMQSSKGIHAAFVFIFLLLACTLAVEVQSASDDHHDHGDIADLELKRLFYSVNASDVIKFVWTKTSVNDPLQLFLVTAGDGVACGEDELKVATELAKEMAGEVNENHVPIYDVQPNSLISVPGAFNLLTSKDNIVASYRLDLSKAACTGIFAFHGPEEMGYYFLNDSSGLELEYAVDDAGVEPNFDSSSVAGAAMGGAILVSALPLLIVLLCSPFAMLKRSEYVHFVIHFMNAFGCGALISVVLLHLYPEMVLAQEAAGLPIWQGGASVLGGICAVALIHFLADAITGLKHDPEMNLRHSHGDDHDDGHRDHRASVHKESLNIQKPQADFDEHALMDVEKQEPKPEAPASFTQIDAEPNHQEPNNHEGAHDHDGHNHDTNDVEKVQTQSSGSTDETRLFRMGTCHDLIDFKSIHPLLWGITVGDALHNFVDGTLIATAFIACGPVTGWTTIGATIAHEIPQELGDFSVMLSKGATVGQALFFNLVAQAFALLGCGVVLAIGDGLPVSQTSFILAFGIGTFLFIALTDVMPLVLEVREPAEYLAVFLGFVLSCTAIGLSTMGGHGCGESGDHNH